LDKPPKGTEEELIEARLEAEDYQVRILDYADTEEFPEELVAARKRLDFYGVRGPRRGFSIGDDKSKLWQADVLYILTCTVPSAMLAKKYNVNLKLVQRIRRGEVPCWQYEYRLVRRIRKAIRGRYKQVKWKGSNAVVYVIKDHYGDIKHYVTSERKAKEYAESLYGDWKKLGYYIEDKEVLN